MTYPGVSIATIVEGDGEVEALPILLRRMAEQWPQATGRHVEPLKPIRVRRDRFLNKDDEFQRYLELAVAKAGMDGWVLVLLDADDDCPVQRGAEILERAHRCVAHPRLSVVFANREFEAWFIAAARSLDGCRGFSLPPGERDRDTQDMQAEMPRNAKAWLEQRMRGDYKEILDQPAFAARMDLHEALKGSRSFRKLHTEWKRYIHIA